MALSLWHYGKIRKGYARHKFGEFLKENGVKHILAGVQHPQTKEKSRGFSLFSIRRKDSSKISMNSLSSKIMINHA